MTTIAAQPRRSDYLAQRWLRTGGDHARANASSHRQSQPATATFYDNLNQQTQLLLSAGRLISRLERLRAPSLTPSASPKSP
jgi:hypothetical protein